MNPTRSHRRRWRALVAVPATAVLLLATLVSSGAAQTAPADQSRLLRHLSAGVAQRWLMTHSTMGARTLRAAAGARRAAATTAAAGRFNRDDQGLPQNEESVTTCTDRPSVVLGGTNDVRADAAGDITGWHLSLDGARTLAAEGLLPPVGVAGVQRPSGGDPVTAAGAGCTVFAGGLNYDPNDPFHQSNGVGVYRSTPARLASCAVRGDPACWPTRSAVATNRPGHFLDKPWFTVGRSGAAGEVVWVVFSDFAIDDAAPLGFTGAQVFAVRCTTSLARCTAPILISGADPDIQFSDVTIGPDGRTVITWAEIQGELELTAQTFVIKMRVAAPGSTTFGPTRVVAVENRAIPFGGLLNANSFRVATYPVNDVATVDGRTRTFVAWAACGVRVLDTVCESAEVKLRWSDDLGATWQGPAVLSLRGQNYFPAISVDRPLNRLSVAYFTSRFDPAFDNRQDVELVTVDTARPGQVLRRQRLTAVSNEPEADPLLNAFFIGDYIGVAAQGGRAVVHYNANYVRVPLLGQGLPIPQQDNFVAVAAE